MLRIEEYTTVDANQMKLVVKGTRNPMNSWDKMDSEFAVFQEESRFKLGENDQKLMQTLAKRGPSHSKFMRMIPVWVTVNAPLYWWKEMDTYKIGTVSNSCSTMHKITEKEFTIDDFSMEHLYFDSRIIFNTIIDTLNKYRLSYLQTKNKEDWWQLIQMLPSSYNQKRTMMLNYQVLSKIYEERKDHKLDEWHAFCDWISILPMSEYFLY